jgi:hypothetical protein
VLLEHDADFTAEDNDGYRAIHVAAEQGHTEAVELLLHVGEQVDVETGDGETLLCVAACNGKYDVVKMLLENGANLHAENDEALFMASESGHVETVKLLLDWGADPRACANAALCAASKHGHLETVELLLDRGADMRARDDYALCVACENGHPEVVRMLLKRGATVHARAGAALRGSTQKGHTSTTAILTEHGLNMLELDDRSVNSECETTLCSTEDVPDTVFAGDVLSLLSVEERGRCACVSQRWRRLSETPSTNAFLRFEHSTKTSLIARIIGLAGTHLRSLIANNGVDVSGVLSAIRQSTNTALEILELRVDEDCRYSIKHQPNFVSYEVVDMDQLNGLIADFSSLRRLCLDMTIPCALLTSAVKLLPLDGEWTIRICGDGHPDENLEEHISERDFGTMCELLQTEERVKMLVGYPPGCVRPVWLSDNRVKQLVNVLATNSNISVLDLSDYGIRAEGAFALASALDNEDLEWLVLNDRRSFSGAAYAALQKHANKVQFEDEDDDDSDLDNPHSNMFMGYGSD